MSRSVKKTMFENDDIKNIVLYSEAIAEIAVLVLAYYLVWRTYYKEGILHSYEIVEVMLLLLYTIIIFILFLYCESFKFGQLKLTEMLISQIISVMFANIITYLQLCLMADRMISVLPMFALMGLDLVITLVCTYLFTALYHNIFAPQSIIMICEKKDTLALKFKMDTSKDKYCVDKIVYIDEGFDKICSYIVNYDAVVINAVQAELRNNILKFCYKNRIHTYMTPKISDIIVRGASDIMLLDTPLLLTRGPGITFSQRVMKRIMDLLICFIALVPAIPVMLIIAILIKLEDRGAVFYRQERVTKDLKKFQILKFRSMIAGAEAGEPLPAINNDPRVTKVGRFIRATRLDELPQLLNIIAGDMSLVGPRPERTEYVERYSSQIPEFEFRAQVKGGLTGYAQVYGKYNTTAYDKLRLDLMYIENYSWRLDIKLLLMTFRVMFKKESTEGFDNL